ncbi:hypothetical protein SDC9_127400 [bioreactor metagenome]|uniref:Uncharacterized protein n=1 Tax=bioreactor metagenome TaxID=1076179 RepID=A0A645CTW9_9ZZZZ
MDAKTETVSSGNVVAKLTIVAPKINSDIPVFLPIRTVHSINMSAPLVIKRNPIKNKIITKVMLFPPYIYSYSKT